MSASSIARLAAICCGILGAVSPAMAQVFDTPALRGSSIYEPGAPVYFRWEGIYGGATASYTSTNVDFGNTTQALTDYILRNSVLLPHVQDWTVLPKSGMNGTGYGLFAGYNAQFDDAVLGVELNYTRGPMSTQVQDSLSLLITDNTGAPDGHSYQYDTTVSSSASIRLIEYATMRLRAGWVYGRFMPYMFGGIAVGRADTMRQASVTATRLDSYVATNTTFDPVTGNPIVTQQSVTDVVPLNIPPPMTVTKKNAFAYGIAGGLGVDVAIMPNLFLRGEWEYVKFAPLHGMRVSLNTFRTGVAFKF